MLTREKIRFLIIRSIGNFLILIAIFGVLATFGPAIYYEFTFRLMQLRGVSFSIGQTSKADQIAIDQKPPKSSLSFADILSGPKEQILIPIDPLFSILIPKIGVNAKIFPNTDPTNPKIFLPVLKEGVAHSAGTLFPGQPGNIYLFAHSTDNFWNVGRYNAAFYLLKDLKAGDEAVIFYLDKRHNYIVKESKIIEPSDVSYIARARTGQERLILQTCWPPGTTWQRLVVIAEPMQ